MAEYVGFRITFDAEYARENRRVLFEAVRAAALENRAKYRDELSWPDDGLEDFDISSLVDQTEPERLRVYGEGDRAWYASAWLTFRFSPLATYSGLLTVFRSEAGLLWASVSVCDSEMRKDDWDRLRRREEVDPEFFDPRHPPVPAPDPDESDLSDYIHQLDAYYEKGEAYARLLRDNHQLWAINRRCLRRIAERLESALPTCELRFDRELLEEDDPRREG
jgi:hypothetical protein